LCQHEFAAEVAPDIVVIGSRALLAERAQVLGLDVALDDYLPGAAQPRQPGHLTVIDVPLAAPCVAGRLDRANSRHVMALLDRAIDGVTRGEFAAVVTAPVQKSVIADAGVAFMGHTEYFAERTGAAHPVMLLAADSLRVALATTHLPLRAVSDAITPALLDVTLKILDADLRRLWGMGAPRIAVCGLNPHAGRKRASWQRGPRRDPAGHRTGPRARHAGRRADPADTVFVPRALSNYDVVLAMYHDQGLPVLKHAGFGHAVNVTLGLPIVRTSVDHGTALDLAGTGRADAGSLIAATRLALEFAGRS
jgi:4-hydroxythreonine-4-phosphate dehydrogenase